MRWGRDAGTGFWAALGCAMVSGLGGCGGGEEPARTEDSIAKCGDRIDNDGDGFVDCNDQDCDVFAMCVGSDSDADTDGDTDVGPCDPPLVDCGADCADLSTDPDHCGDCADACAPEVARDCVDAECTCGDSGRACAGTPEDQCCPDGVSTACVDTTTDEEHCGGCAPCDAGESCADGTCSNCGDDCWGPDGCLTGEGRCIRFTCRSNYDASADFCDSCFGWNDITYDDWMNGGYCLDVTAKYHEVSGTAAKCAAIGVACCGTEAECAGIDTAWHFRRGATVYLTGPNITIAEDVNCHSYDDPANYGSEYLRLTICERP